MKTGDVITSVNGADVADPKELVRRVAQNAPEATAAIGILRDGAARTINVKLGSVAMDAQGRVAADGPAHLQALLIEIRRVFPRLIELYDNTASLQDRTVTTGIVKAQYARQFGAGGFVGRASGRAFDARRAPGYAPCVG